MKKIKLSIPEPCHQHWDDMAPTEQGRFCNACAKEVIDFSQMNDTDVLSYFEIVKHGRVCGRAYPDQLNRPITSLPAKRLFWPWNYVIALFLFFSKSTTIKAQSTVKTIKLPVLKPIRQLNLNNILHQAESKKSPTLSGIIQAENGSGVPFATVGLFKSSAGVVADEDGKFTLTIDNLPCVIEISSLGYKTKQVEITDLSTSKIVLYPNNELMGEVIIACRNSALTGVMGGLSVSTMIKRNFVKDTLKSWISIINPTIKIYPNLILRGNDFTVDLTLKRPGNYIIQIVNTAGAILLQRQINATAKKHNEKFLSGAAWSGGIYYLGLIDDEGKHIATGNIVVQ